jgi:hypothetical protein
LSSEKEIGTSLYLRGLVVARLHREYFMQGQLLRALGGESTVSAEDDVDDVLRILKVLSPRLVTSLIIFLVLSLSSLREGWCIE